MKKIVLIEDDSDLFGLVKYNLEKEGFSFAGSQTGKGAVDLCRRERPDLVILDIMLRPHQESVPYSKRAGPDRPRGNPRAGSRQLPGVAKWQRDRPHRH